MTWVDFEKDPRHSAREKEKARTLKKSAWWKNKIATGLCHFCGQKFAPAALTMDHLVPMSRGGKSTKSNLVPACKSCNQTKEHMTPAELILDSLAKSTK